MRRVAPVFLLLATLLGVSLPGFWVGILSVLVFALWLRWLPAGAPWQKAGRVLAPAELRAAMVALARSNRVLREEISRRVAAEQAAGPVADFGANRGACGNACLGDRPHRRQRGR